MNSPMSEVDLHPHAPIREVQWPVGDGTGPHRKRQSDAAYSGARLMKRHVAILGDEGTF